MNFNAPSLIRWGMANVPPRIVWQGCEPEQLILELYAQDNYVKSSVAARHRLVRELYHLLDNLFAQHAQEILVEVLSHGLSGTRVVKAQPFYAQGAGQQLVVKIGNLQIIKQEHENYRKYVRDFIGSGSAVALDYQAMAHLGAISYTFLGTAAHQMQEFGAFYQQASPAQVKQALDTLFRRTCGMWYANHALQPLNWTEDYQRQFGYGVKQVEQETVKRLLSVSWQGKLRFQSLQISAHREFTNPFGALKAVEPVIRPAYVGITHGDLNQRNILVDSTEHPWLIDFQSTGPSHILRDVAMLDTVVRLQLLRPEQATLEERLALEEAICNIKHFNQLESLRTSYATRNPALAKTWETVVHLRTLARWMIEKNPLGDLSEYSFAVLYSTMNSLSFNSLEETQREHALLAASLLADTLGLGK